MDKIASTVTPKQKNKRIFMIVVGILIAIVSIPITLYPATAIGLFTAYVGVYKKEIIVDQNNLCVKYHFVIKTSKVSYGLGEYQNVLIDQESDFSRIGFTRNGVTTYSTFKTEDVENIVSFFRGEKPNINIQFIKLKSKFGQ